MVPSLRSDEYVQLHSGPEIKVFAQSFFEADNTKSSSLETTGSQ